MNKIGGYGFRVNRIIPEKAELIRQTVIKCQTSPMKADPKISFAVLNKILPLVIN
jgi:hypothetical protein